MDDAWWDLWLTPDQQGRRLLEQGKYEKAAEKFADPMWKGSAYYAASKWKKAQEQFARVNTAEGLFNLANAHAQAREIASAIHDYDKALKKNPTFREARENRDYFQQVLDGLQESSDMEESGKPDAPADPTKAALHADQLSPPSEQAPKEPQEESGKKDSLSAAENDQWMRRVSTNPADFLRTKFSIQAQQGEKP